MKRIFLPLVAILLTGCSLQCLPSANAAEEKTKNTKSGELLKLTIKDVKFRFRFCPAGR